MAITSEDIARFTRENAQKIPQDIIAWALRTFGRKAPISSSFGAEDVVLIDMAARIDRNVRIFTLDTGRLPEETHQVIEAIRRKYSVAVEVFFPDTAAVERLVAAKGTMSFRESVENRKECCAIRKIEPLRRALSGSDAWLTGLRRAQSVTRADVAHFEIDATQNGILKINPLADWSEAQVWEYIRKNNVPYNRLHDLGFPSIGCEPCTRAVQPGEDIRAGRWWWESPDKKECGLHPGRRPAGTSEAPKNP